MKGLPAMAAIMRQKVTAALPTMGTNWSAAKSRMKAGYAETPFGPTRKNAYNRKIDAATYVNPDVDTMVTHWERKMGE